MTPSLRRAEEAVLSAVERLSKHQLHAPTTHPVLYADFYAVKHAFSALSALRASQAGEPYWCGRCAKVVTDTEPSGHRLHSKCRGIVSDPPPSYAPTLPAEEAKPEKCDAVIGCGGKGVDGWGATCLRCGGDGVEPSCAPSTEKGGERK